MPNKPPRDLKERVEQAANSVLKASGSAGPLELMLQLGWLAPSHFVSWKKGIIPSLVEVLQVGNEKQEKAFHHFEEWARNRRLKAVKVPYVRSTPRGEIPLRATTANNPAAEEFFQIHYIQGNLPAAKTERTIARLSNPPDIVVFQTVSASLICTECKMELHKGNFLFMEKGQPLCLTCADFDQLEFLPSGDATLTRRARKYSNLSAVVVRFARARGRYERQGILVEPEAIEKAELECLSDEDLRMARRERDSMRRAAQDKKLVTAIAQSILRLYPGCPADEAEKIARHTAERGSGRVGRSPAGRDLEAQALELAVIAWVRHCKTNYDKLLGCGIERIEARKMVSDKIQEVLARWTEE